MLYFHTDIYEQFTCEKCGACCRNPWQVTVDEDSYLRNACYFTRKERSREFQTAFIPAISGNNPGEYASIAKQDNGWCWFLGADNLCCLHKEAGHEHLDSVCRTFPRYPMNTSRGIELTLSFSCPAVLRLVSRPEPLTIIRSEQVSGLLDEDNYAAAVYPQQKQASDPLRYYFELEQHFIDIIQCRGLQTGERLALVNSTVSEIIRAKADDFSGQVLNDIFSRNYDILDAKNLAARHGGCCTPDILLEHFFVNFIFKKPFYLYGLQQTGQMLLQIWQHIVRACENQSDKEAMERIQSAILEIEFQYGHDRKKFLQCAACR